MVFSQNSPLPAAKQTRDLHAETCRSRASAQALGHGSHRRAGRVPGCPRSWSPSVHPTRPPGGPQGGGARRSDLPEGGGRGGGEGGGGEGEGRPSRGAAAGRVRGAECQPQPAAPSEASEPTRSCGAFPPRSGGRVSPRERGEGNGTGDSWSRNQAAPTGGCQLVLGPRSPPPSSPRGPKHFANAHKSPFAPFSPLIKRDVWTKRA